MTPEDLLIEASNKGDLKKVNELLLKNTQINYKHKNDWTPLLYACFRGHQEVVDALLKNKADIHLPRPDGVTPLFMASQQGHEQMVTTLINHKANIDQPTKDGITPLSMACYNGHREVVLILLTHKANIHTPNKWNKTPLDYAREKGFTEIVKIIEEKKTTTTTTTTNTTTTTTTTTTALSVATISTSNAVSSYSSGFTGDLSPIISISVMSCPISTSSGTYMSHPLSLNHPILKGLIIDGWEIEKAVVVVNSSQQRLFFGCIEQSEKRQKQPAFQTKIIDTERIETLNKIINPSRPYILKHNRSVTLARLYHGTSANIAESIVTTGFASLATLDDGWFGRAVYLTDNPQYAMQYCQDKDQPCIIISDTILFNPYPILSCDAPWDVTPSMFTFYGKPPIQNFKCHIIPVTHKSGVDYRPPPDVVRENHTPLEFAIFDENHLHPRVLVYYRQCETVIQPPPSPLSPSNVNTDKRMPSQTWTVDDVIEWMKSLSLNRDYTELIKENNIDGEVLLTMSDGDWKELGVNAFGDRRKLVNRYKK